ncbi:MAG: acetate--CoA ligase family protein [Polyangiaceae bacterium]|jgi:acetyl coenzyme A synthetase (ADP forming)-like protein|nr:acetate--CoA ligase family protein [Polyangiaceae bacterium]
MPDSLRPLLEPKSIAVVGASRTPGTVGGELFRNLLQCGFPGAVYPVHPKADAVQSVRAYRDIREIPDRVDLAVVAVPAKAAVQALEACGEKGVRAAIVISAGFKEVGEEGLARERELLAVAHRYGMRVLGPNCLGLLNTNPDRRVNATFAGVFPKPGPVSFASQSGALGAVVLQLAARRNIGLASFVSVGNKCDISGNDLLEYWEQDSRTRVILMYLESFGNPRRFTHIARRVGRTKPIVAVKSGRSRAGSRAAASHTGALAGADIAVDALFRQAGVIRVDTTEELFDTAMLLATQPVPQGKRVGIVTNAGGPGILASDACENYGLSLATLNRATVAQLRGFLPPEASLRNPVDMIASATAADYGQTVRTMLGDPQVDALLVIFVPPLMVHTRDVAREIASAAAGSGKTILSCYMGAHGLPEGLWRDGESSAQIPSYRFPEAAVRALSKTVSYGQWLKVADSPVANVDVDVALASATVEACRDALSTEDVPVWLDPSDVPRLLSAYGIRTPESAFATSPTHAASIAQELGFPVALKVVSDRIIHKTDVGGVILDRRDADEVRRGFDAIVTKARSQGLEDTVQGVLVQRYLSEGIEAVVGMTHDPAFGPLIMFGLGGAYVELVQDVVFRLHPLTEHDIDGMIRQVRAYKLLEGYRGKTGGDVAALRDLLRRVSQMVTDIPELVEMDLNPVMILAPGKGCVAVDARMRLSNMPGQASRPSWFDSVRPHG